LVYLWILTVVLAALGCELVARSSDLRATTVALSVKQTSLALTEVALTQVVGHSPPTPMPTAAAPANPLPPPLATPTLQPQATAGLASTGPDDRLLKSARILLFEDMSASRYIRLAKEALDKAGYFYLDVGSAKGWFKNQLLSGQEWDLVIAAAEAERDFGGEFYGYLDDRLANGAAVVIENWDFDKAAGGSARKLLDRCGVDVESDWYEPELRVFFWTDPAHPIFNQPNRLASGLRNAQRVWVGDVGDLFKLRDRPGMPGGDAMILASTNPEWKSDHGTLVVCLGGRLILQAFRSHEYQHNDMVALWQNYVYHLLSSAFAQSGRAIPTPPATYLPGMTSSLTPPAETPGPDYTLPHACGDAFRARLVDAPRFQRDLFEHHAIGEFLILRLELTNQSSFPIQVWDDDYLIEASLGGETETYPLDKAATGYLYIESPTHLWQDLIQPGQTWRTALAFDVPSRAANWEFVLRPGSEFGEQVCELRIPLAR
jgi:hypothetical protein